MRRFGIIRLVYSINRSRFFSVFADERTDACQERLSLCLEYFVVEECFPPLNLALDLAREASVSLWFIQFESLAR